MITPNKLFFKRLISEWKYNFSIWRTVIDWTIALYIVIPLIAFGIDQYWIWWHITPNWLNIIPFNFFIATNVLFAWSGTIRVFIQEADQIFLLNQNKWVKAIIKRGIAYSIVLNLILSFFFFLILAPFLIVHYKISNITLVVLFLITFMSKIALGLLKQIIELYFYGFKQVLLLRGIFISISSLFITFFHYFILENSLVCYIFIIFLLIINCILVNKRINIKGSFFDDIEREQNERLKYVNILLGLSGMHIRKPKKQRIRPWLFSKSNLIFKKRTAINGLVELCIKSTLRNKKYVIQYFQFVILCVLTTLAFSAIGWLIWLGMAFILTNFVSLYWKEVMGSDFVKIFQWKTEDKYYASRKFLFIMTLPGFMLVSFAIGFQSFLWIGAFSILPISVGVVYYMSKIVSYYI